jgi:AcrR family transcriptional regulator
MCHTVALVATTTTSLASGTSERILDAAFERIGEWGLARTTVEDVARAAGLTRQTIYRYFPSKDHLVTALLMREEDRLLDGVRDAFEHEDRLEDALLQGMLFCDRFVEEHPFLERLLQTDEELSLPYVTTRAGSVVSRAREVIASLIRRKAWVRASMVEPVSDLLVRAFISYTITPPERPRQDVIRDLTKIALSALTGDKEGRRR